MDFLFLTCRSRSTGPIVKNTHVNGVKPKALFAYHYNSLSRNGSHTSAFSTMPLSTSMARSKTNPVVPSSQYSPPASGTMTVRLSPHSVPSYHTNSLAATSMVDRSQPPGHRLNDTGSAYTQASPATTCHRKVVVESVENDDPFPILQGLSSGLGSRNTSSSATVSVLSPSSYQPAFALPSCVNATAGWEAESKVHGRYAAPVSQRSFTPVLTCAPLPLHDARKAISRLPKRDKRTASAPKSKMLTSQAMYAGTGEAPATVTWVNMTASDSATLLSGVAPSGSQKRKRDGSESSESSTGKRSKQV